MIVSDAWEPQVNGVVRALATTCEQLRSFGHEVTVLGPDQFRNFPCPTYPEIRLAFATPGRVGRCIQAYGPDAIHIATEGPLGLCARHWLKRQGRSFTTSVHTMFPMYLKLRFGIPQKWTFAGMRWFHGAAEATMYSTENLAQLLSSHGFKHLQQWVRGVDTELFQPQPPVDLGLTGPIMMYVGRLGGRKES